MIHGFLRRARKCWHHLFSITKYYWYHKIVFGVTNTKFDISCCVFRESFLNDQYGIRKFLKGIGSSSNILFLDIGRNHGFVFYYMMYYIMRTNFQVSVVNYYGIDPSPLKFVYFNFQDYLSKRGIKINYHIIDRAVVFAGEHHAMLKYGEGNFGNFHVLGSNYAQNSAARQSDFEYVNIIVETIHFCDLLKIISDNIDCNSIIVKIDCKNRTDYMFTAILDMLSVHKINYLVSCERDGSCNRDVSAYAIKDANVLSASNTV